MGAKPSNCLFCNIINNEKNKLLYEDDEIAVFEDINPAAARAHLLVCPKRCIRDVNHL